MSDAPVSAIDQIVLQFSMAGRYWQSRLIGRITHSEFSHSALVLPSGDLLDSSGSPHCPVVTGNPNGVAIRQHHYETFTLTQRAVIKTAAAPAIMAFCKDQLGKPFDDTALHAFLGPPPLGLATADRDWRDPAMWFCSELLCRACEVGGLWNYRIVVPPNRVAPPDLLMLLNPLMDMAAWDASRWEDPDHKKYLLFGNAE